MLPSTKRVGLHLFEEIMKRGKWIHTSHLSFKMLPIEGPSRCAIAVSKKVDRRAAKRNSIKRRLYSLLRSYYPTLPQGFAIVVMPKKGALDVSLSTFEAEVISLINKL